MGNHHREVIGTHARHAVRVLGQLQQPPGHLLEERVACLSTERIVVCEVLDLFFFLDVIERERNVAGEFQKQLHLLVVEKTGIRRVQRKYADGLATDGQGNDRQGVDPARPAKPCPPGWVAATASGAESKKPRTSPAQATGFTCIACLSTTPSQAMRNFPLSTAMRHASRNNSSRSRTRTSRALMPLSTAYTRFRRWIFASASLRAVMSRIKPVNNGSDRDLIAVIVSSIGNSVPSTRIASSSSRLPRTGPSPVAR